MPPSISILIAAHGDEPHLVNSVQSALNQDYPDFTVILTHTLPVPPAITALADQRLKIIPVPPTSTPYQAAVKAAPGEYVYCLSAGDHFYQPTSLTEVSAAAQTAHADLLVAKVIRLENNVLYFPQHKQTQPRLLTTNNFALLARFSVAVRTLSGNLIQRALLTEVLATTAPNTNEQILVYRLVQQAQHPVESSHLAVVWRERADHQLPALDWEALPPLSPLKQLLPPAAQRIATPPVPERISLALGIDQGVEAHLAPLLYSITQTNTAPVDVYVVATQLSVATQAQFAWFNERFANLRVVHTPLPAADYDMIRQLADFGHHGPLSVYYRVFLPQLLPHLDRVIYLDADTLVTGDLTALWHSDLHGNLLGCVRDDGSGVTPPPEDPTDWWAYKVLGPAGKDYFNSGMLVFDLYQWRKYNLGVYFYEFLRDTVNLYLLEDQDALNFFCQGAVTYLSPAVNCVTKSLQRNPRTLRDTTILHFLGPQKPWKMTFNQPRVQWPAIAHYRHVARAWAQAYQPELPVISILLDAALDEDYLLEQLESLLCQSYGHLEVIIVTAAPAPAPESPLAQLLALNEPLHLVCQAGPTTAHRWQTGLAAAHGEFIFLLGPHDRLTEPTVIVQLAALQRKYAADIVTGYRLTYLPARQVLRGTANSGRVQELSQLTLPQLLPVGIGEYQWTPGHLIRRTAFKHLNWTAPLIPQLLVQAPKKIHWEQNIWFHRKLSDH